MMDDNFLLIMDVFGYRCVRCGRSASTIHEMIPRSSGKESMNVNNRVPICRECHQWAHDVGTNKSAPVLERARDRILARLTGSGEQNVD